MSYYGFSAARYLPSINQAYATKGAATAQLGQAIAGATQTVAEAVAQQKKAEQLLKENKEYFDQSYNATYRLYKDKLVDAGVPEVQADKIIQTHLTPITPMEYKNPKVYLETKAQQAKQLDNYIAKLEGQQSRENLASDVQSFTQPRQVLGTQRPTEPMGEGPAAQAQMSIGGYFGEPTGQTTPSQAQTREELTAKLSAGGQYTPEQIKGAVGSTALPSTKEAQSPEDIIEKRVTSAGGLDTSMGIKVYAQGYQGLEQQAGSRLKKMEELQKALSKNDTEKAIQLQNELNLPVDKLNQLPRLMAEAGEKQARYKAEVQHADKLFKEWQKQQQKKHALELQKKSAGKPSAEKPAKESDFLSYLNAKYPSDVVERILRIPEKLQKELENFNEIRRGLGITQTGSGGTSAPPTGTGESTFEMDGVEYSY